MNTTRWNGRVFCAALISLSVFQFACADEMIEDNTATTSEALEVSQAESLEEYNEHVAPVFLHDIPSQEAAEALFEDGVAHLESSDAFRQVSWMMDIEDASSFEYRALNDGEWGEWEPVEITFKEGIFHNALIRLDAPTNELQMRGGELMHAAQLEFYEEIIARDEAITVTDPTTDTNFDDIRTATQAVAPTSLVIPRSSWGAVNPGKVCGNTSAPYRMAIHHTYLPSGDGGDAAARMRQMQNSHINSNGWCDIGYHFVVSQSGHIYQGRSHSDRPGAHVGGNNTGNVGISFIADFTKQNITSTQKNAAANIMRWVHNTHGVPLNRNSVLGHGEHSGASTSCPGNLVNGVISELITMAGGTATAPQPSQPQPSQPSSQPTPTSGGTTSGGGTGSGGSSGGSSGYSIVDTGCSSTGSSTPGDSPLSLLLLAALAMIGIRRKA